MVHRPKQLHKLSKSDSSQTDQKPSIHRKQMCKSSRSDSSQSVRRKKQMRKSSRSDSCTKSNSSPRSRSSCSSYNKRSFRQKYQWYKNCLLDDPTVMIGGSDAYGSYFNGTLQALVSAGSIFFNTENIILNINHLTDSAEINVRKDGVYLVEFTAQPNQPAQFTFFINGIPQFNTAVGQNSGAGELIGRNLLVLKKDDEVSVKNYFSAMGTITINQSSGGTAVGLSTEIVLRKIAPHPDINVLVDSNNLNNNYNYLNANNNNYHHNNNIDKGFTISEKRERFFDKLVCKLKEDCELLMMGANVRGSFFRQTSVTLQLEESLPFTFQQEVVGLTLQPNNTDILVSEDGVYQILFLIESATSIQMALFQNGTPQASTIIGINKGANQLYLHQIMSFKKGDVISLRNHSSNVGAVTISQIAGNSITGINAIFILTRVGPLKPLPMCEQLPLCEIPRKVQKFKQYMLRRHDIMPFGYDAYWSLFRTNQIIYNVGDVFTFPLHGPLKNVTFVPGTSEIIIQKDGIYQVKCDLNADAPAQVSVFINGVVETSTTEGTDSGAGQMAMRQIIGLCKGDKVTLVNYTSITPISTQTNAGGLNVGYNVNFMGFRIAPLPEKWIRKCIPNKKK